MNCPFRPLEEEKVRETDEDVQARPDGVVALENALKGTLAGSQLGRLGDLLGPLLALFTVVRGVQTLGGLPVGNITKAGFAEEATTRVLQPKMPPNEGPRPARPSDPVRAPRFTPARASGGGGGFFSNQTAELKQMMGRR